MDTQTLYQKAILFAGEKHCSQKVPGSSANYLLHLANVTMEVMVAANHSKNFDLQLAVQVALLHDVIEDTGTDITKIETNFGKQIAQGVLALTKNESLPKNIQIADSLHRIKQLPKEIWAVKLADRISNMQKPPTYWKNEKMKNYQQAAILILHELHGGNSYLEKRLETKIKQYNNYF